MAAPWAGDNPFQEEQPFGGGQFDIIDWHPYFQSCVRYFIEHAQFEGPVQALAAFINIQLPFQKAQQNPTLLRRSPSHPGGPSHPPGGPGRLSPAAAAAAGQPPQPVTYHVSLHPYIRRLIATGFDFPAVLHGFFGDDWELGVRPLHEQERRNFLFAAKSSSWLEVKRAYDMGTDETVPFLKPLRNASEQEIRAGEGGWSEWLAMQDWMLGPRSMEVRGDTAGGSRSGAGGVRIKREEED
ncbi:uncharacterized protein C8A04DRAFT_24942 [Dichotomopilus funicola]|uniref:Ilp is an apoptosis inhibitor n=1 Tax=Dichotomopilus funicola TaxID=1934379 RepID=A0AAN6VA26_9PEZI|nr:hypothetical protein C8A04DRAFT_24942 [Dichotomopilus funicola]